MSVALGLVIMLDAGATLWRNRRMSQRSHCSRRSQSNLSRIGVRPTLTSVELKRARDELAVALTDPLAASENGLVALNSRSRVAHIFHMCACKCSILAVVVLEQCPLSLVFTTGLLCLTV